MPNKWITHVKQYHSDHPKLNYKQAMQQARPSYNKIQKGKGGGVSKPSIALNPMIPVIEQEQIESRQRERANNNRIEAQEDQIQNIRNQLVSHIIKNKGLHTDIHRKIDSFLNY